MADITVFLARTVRTIEPSLPVAEAIAVQGGRIVEVGTLETMRPWLESHSHEIDDTFKDHCIMPGFVDPHLHPSMAAILLPMHRGGSDSGHRTRTCRDQRGSRAGKASPVLIGWSRDRRAAQLRPLR